MHALPLLCISCFAETCLQDARLSLAARTHPVCCTCALARTRGLAALTANGAATAAAVLAAEDVAGVAHALAHALAAHGAAPCSNAGEEDQGAGAERQPLETRTPPAAGQGQGTEAASAHTMDHSRRSTPSDPALASAAAALETARRAGAVSPLAHLSAAASSPVPVCIWNEGLNC